MRARSGYMNVLTIMSVIQNRPSNRENVGMVGKEYDKLPSKATVLNMNLQRLQLSRQNVGEVFATEKESCPLTDETSRKGAKYMGYEASDSSGKLWVLGIREMASKSVADTLSVFKEILRTPHMPAVWSCTIKVDTVTHCRHNVGESCSWS